LIIELSDEVGIFLLSTQQKHIAQLDVDSSTKGETYEQAN
jgi:hypothetical protein